MLRILIAAFAFLAVAFAGAVPMNQQSCIARNYGLVINYHINIGRPWMQSKCDNAIKNIKNSGSLPSMVVCGADSRGMVYMTFNAMRDRQGKINRALDKSFPVIRDNGHFNCPGH